MDACIHMMIGIMYNNCILLKNINNTNLQISIMIMFNISRRMCFRNNSIININLNNVVLLASILKCVIISIFACMRIRTVQFIIIIQIELMLILKLKILSISTCFQGSYEF